MSVNEQSYSNVIFCRIKTNNTSKTMSLNHEHSITTTRNKRGNNSLTSKENVTSNHLPPKTKWYLTQIYVKRKLESVTASSGTAISTDMFRNFVKNSFKFDVALKHAQDEVPARKSTPEKQKSPLATNKHRRRQKDVPNAYRTRYCVYL